VVELERLVQLLLELKDLILHFLVLLLLLVVVGLVEDQALIEMELLEDLAEAVVDLTHLVQAVLELLDKEIMVETELMITDVALAEDQVE
jgi:hypothetical protein